MKPDWKDAPEWANWLAMDGDGAWFWYESEPAENQCGFWNTKNGMFERVENIKGWDKSKEKRP